MRSTLLCLLLILGSAATAAAQPPACPAGGTVFLARHGEKLATGNAELDKDASLSGRGEERAEALAHTLRDAGVDAIYASQYRRTQETAAPLAKSSGVAAKTVQMGEELGAALADQIRAGHCGQQVLVVGHSNTLPGVMAALGVAPTPEIGNDSYDRLFVVRWLPGAAAEMAILRFGAATP